MAAPAALRPVRDRDLPGWLTAVVARVSLDMLRARRARREHYSGSWLPEPLVSLERGRETDPE
jgi:DNA-directed RNA polymerase specialized sigma24 family protein